MTYREGEHIIKWYADGSNHTREQKQECLGQEPYTRNQWKIILVSPSILFQAKIHAIEIWNQI